MRLFDQHKAFFWQNLNHRIEMSFMYFVTQNTKHLHWIELCYARVVQNITKKNIRTKIVAWKKEEQKKTRCWPACDLN